MERSVGNKRRTALRVLQQGSTVLGCALLVVIWAAVTLTIQTTRQRDLENAERNLDMLGRAYADDASRSLKDVDKTLLLLRRAYEANPGSFDLAGITRSAYFISDVTLQIAWIGADGMLAGTNLGPQATPVYLGDREHFRVHRDTTEDKLYISAPVLGRTSGRWSVQLTRRLVDREGAFAGVLVASVDPDYLARFFASIDQGIESRSAVTLVGDDGIVRARGSHDGASALGQSIAGTPLMARLAQRGPGLVTTASPFTGQTKLMAYRPVPDFPLSVVVARPLEAVAAGHTDRLQGLIAGASALSLLVLAGMLASSVHALRLDRAREALASSEARASLKSHELAVALENMSQGIMMIDAEQVVAVINRRCIELLGLPERFLENRPAFAEILAHQWEIGEFGDQGSALEPQVLDFIRSGGAGDSLTVYERRRPNGTVLEVRSLPLPGGGIVRTYTDVTQRTEASGQLAEARDRAEAASRARTAFLAMMSHEIRTPLNGVIGMASLLAGTHLDGEQLRYTATLRDSAEHLLQVIDDVLDFSKLEADRGTREEVSFDLERTVETVVAMVAPRARDKGLFVGALVDPAIPDLVVGDSGAVRQVLLNLAGNGVKFTAEGSVTVEAEALPASGADTVLVRFRVRDTGIGIAEDDVPGLFREFSQLDDSISRRFGGTGLGLAISKHLVEREGGSIDVDSEPGRGSTFSFTLPLRRAPGASRTPARRPLSGQRWIVVAPHADARSFDSRLLQTAGAMASATGIDELGALLRNGPPPHGLLVDPGAADVDLAGVVEQMRAAHLTPRPRLLAVAALGSSCRRATDLGFDAVLKAPLTRRDLVDAALALPGPALPAAAASVPASPAPPARLPSRVLLADDNVTSRLVLEAMLARLGCEVTAVEDGRAAVERAASNPFDVVLLDLTMPGFDGFAAARAIRALPPPAGSVAMVAVTADLLAADTAAVRAAGMDALAVKPIGRDQLAALLRKASAARLQASVLRANPAGETGGAFAGTAEPDPRDGGNNHPAGAAPELVSPAASSPASLAPVMDREAWDRIAEALGPEMIEEIVDAFIEDTGTRIASMGQPGAAPATIAREAHALKSAAGTFGFARLQAMASAVEEAAQAPAAADLPALVAQLRALFDEASATAWPGRPPAAADPPHRPSLVA